MYNHNHHQDVYTITNPMTYSYANAMGNKSSTGSNQNQIQPTEISHETWLQLNDSPLSTTGRNNIIGDLKQSQDVLSKQSKIKYVINGILLAIVIGAIALVESGYFPPLVRQSFFCKERKISFKYRGDTISMSILGVVTIFLPLTIFLAVEYIRNGNEWRQIISMTCRWLKYFIIGMFVVNLLITAVLKTIFGEPRPHFLDTCSPDAAETCLDGDLVEQYRCTNTQYSHMFIVDSSRSFPSGHASVSVFTSVYCALYIYYRFNVHSLGSVLKPLLISFTMLWGLTCGITRITDHRHHWWDVLAGSVLGAITALFSIYCLAGKFRGKQLSSVSSTKLWSNKDDVSV